MTGSRCAATQLIDLVEHHQGHSSVGGEGLDEVVVHRSICIFLRIKHPNQNVYLSGKPCCDFPVGQDLESKSGRSKRIRPFASFSDPKIPLFGQAQGRSQESSVLHVQANPTRDSTPWGPQIPASGWLVVGLRCRRPRQVFPHNRIEKR